MDTRIHTYTRGKEKKNTWQPCLPRLRLPGFDAHPRFTSVAYEASSFWPSRVKVDGR